MPKIEIGYYKPLHGSNFEFIHDDSNTQTINESPHGDISTLEDITEDQIKWDPLQILKLQQYQPIYSLFFDMTETNYNSIQLNHRYHFLNTTTVYDTINNETIEKPIFIKYSPLYDPIRFMMGKYDLSDPKLLSLPNIHSTDLNTPVKFLDTNNASYTDCFFQLFIKPII